MNKKFVFGFISGLILGAIAAFITDYFLIHYDPLADKSYYKNLTIQNDSTNSELAAYTIDAKFYDINGTGKDNLAIKFYKNENNGKFYLQFIGNNNTNSIDNPGIPIDKIRVSYDSNLNIYHQYLYDKNYGCVVTLESHLFDGISFYKILSYGTVLSNNNLLDYFETNDYNYSRYIFNEFNFSDTNRYYIENDK